jgi:hypothetical protein
MPNQPLVLTRYKITHGNHPRSTSLARVFQCLAVPRQPPEVFGNTGNASSRNSDQISLIESRHLARFRRRLSRGAWLFPRSYLRFSRFGCRFSRRWQFRLGLFRSAMVAMVQRLNARGFFFQTQLSVFTFLVLVFKVFWNSFRCHGQQCGRTIPVQAVQFWSLGDNSSTASKRWRVGKTAPLSLVPRSRRVSALQGLFPDGGASKESPVPKPFRRSAPNVESDAASALVCWISDIRTDANPRPAL